MTGSQVGCAASRPAAGSAVEKCTNFPGGPSVSLYWLCVYSNECMKMGVGSVSV